jgi:aspartate racemase
MTKLEPIPAERDAGALLASVAELVGTASEYPRDSSVVELFESVVARFPERTALKFSGNEISYGELNRRVNQLASRLIREGVTPGSFVAIYAERSIELVCGILAILKAGSAYVPLDTTYPADRIDWMIQDSGASMVLAQQKLEPSLRNVAGIRSIRLDEVHVAHPVDAPNPPKTAVATSLAYVMYTSGSTGRPKGVMVEHRSIVRLVTNTNFCELGPEQVFLQLAPVSFDASTFEIWGALLQGATLVIMPPQAPSLLEIGEQIQRDAVTTLWLTAGLFHLFVDQRLSDLAPLRQLLAGGDSLSAVHVRKVLDAFPHITLINGYGPTENTTFTCCHQMRNGDQIADSVSIGRPISNTFVYLLDENRKPVERGAVGEIFAGGDGVARGYLNAADLTAERFFLDSFSSRADARMYRTGDMARWLPDGTLEFLGRRDHQVKILGHRIELGEIEAVLARHPAVLQNCVVVKSSELNNKRLAAFVVLNSSAAVAPSELKMFLTRKLPAYMVPANICLVGELPLTPNGKIDRVALSSLVVEDDLKPPLAGCSALEQQIADIWKSVLGTQRIGLDDNFFDLGGDSLLIVAIHAKLQETLHRELQIIDLFEYATVRSLARHIGAAATKSEPFSAAQEQARKQREALARHRPAKGVPS